MPSQGPSDGHYVIMSPQLYNGIDFLNVKRRSCVQYKKKLVLDDDINSFCAWDSCALNQFIWKKNCINNYVPRFEDDSLLNINGILWFNSDNQKELFICIKFT